ncbi:type I restriction endonuclease subunit R [Acetobacterium wieringae]|uniref:type I restriction endonuclease subunit R n=1 Tax=Acetobacterium wieringae TaxID=52694 RepID=UPI0026F15DA3|nr:type I restriction endonuclease subunit R [Acetobacterium wieringae]
MSLSETFTEAFLEEAAIEILTSLGYSYAFGPDISPGGAAPERQDHRDVLLSERIREALFSINRDLPKEALDEAFRQVISLNSPMLSENNRQFHRLLTEGIEVSFMEAGHLRTKRAFLINYDEPDKNDFLVVNQFTIIEHENRRPDLILFVNGLPLVVVELKSASDENVGISSAYNQIQTYKKDIPALFVYNAFCILTDGINARAGTLTASEERFMNWRTVDGVDIAPKNHPQYEVLFKGMLAPGRILELIRDFILFQESKQADTDETGKKHGETKAIVKILAAYHQYFAAKKALEKTRAAVSETGDRKIGVIWHTQGSGKSFSMVFYTAGLVRTLNNPTVVVITDRNDLDDQLYATFAKSRDILRQTPVQADVRRLSDSQKAQAACGVMVNGLYELLNERESGGIIFTTIQKFTPESGEMPILTDRSNVIIIADEAHRSQYGLSAKTDLGSGAVKYGYAKYLRDALPNASFIGFTGTPIDLADRSTTSVFGECIDTYDMTRAVEDEATVRIYYENRIIRLDTDENALAKIDADFEAITEGQEDSVRDKNRARWTRLEAVVGSPNRIRKLAEDIVAHYEAKARVISGKAMVVCMSRLICVDLYNAIIALRPDWHSDDVDAGKIKVVITGSAADPEKLQPHIGGKQRRDILARRMKDDQDDLKIVLVRDMWLTGFDVPSLHTMYIDKPMQGHSLMQAIARVNRVFKEKSGGVVVDYLGILESLKSALKQYTSSDRGNTGVDVTVAASIMQEKLEILRGILHGFDYRGYFGDSQVERLRVIIGGMDFILGKPENEQKDFKKTVIELAKAHSLCAATEVGKALALEVSYFKAVKASLVKISDPETPPKPQWEVDARLRQLLERSIISEDVIDVFDVLGIKRPDIAILSEEFLNEIREMKEKNLAREMLKKLLEGKIKALERSNLVKAETFSEKLTQALNRYRNQAITNAEVIEELIRMAHEIARMKASQASLGLNDDEIAFYDALTADDIVREFMEDATLKTIAQELTIAIRNNITIDWSIRKSAQASMRKIIKRLLKKYKYPPEQADKALKIVMRQAEKMCENVVHEGFWYEKVAEEKAEYRVER